MFAKIKSYIIIKSTDFVKSVKNIIHNNVLLIITKLVTNASMKCMHLIQHYVTRILKNLKHNLVSILNQLKMHNTIHENILFNLPPK